MRAINAAASDTVTKDEGLRDEFSVKLEGFRDDFSKKIEGLRYDVCTKVEGLRREVNTQLREFREECRASYVTKADIAVLKSQLTLRIVVAQVTTATLLFALLKLFP